MPDTQKQDNPNPAENLGKMFESFGTALSRIFDDPVLKAKAKDFGQSAAASAKTFASRFKDEEVKEGFRDVGKAAEQFGKSVADQFKGDERSEKLMVLQSRRDRDRHRNLPAGALSQADNPGQLVFKADCSCPKTKCKRHGYCEPCRAYHSPKPPLCEK